MTPIDTGILPGLPAPFWFIELFKITGFVLHSIPMHLWLVGFPIALLLFMINGRNGSFYGRRMLKQFPIIMALGINFGIVPLLFLQTAYYKAFYPATILMAVHWMAILGLVMVAYYGIYGCAALSVKARRRWTVLLGFFVSLCLITCGLIFASAFTLMALPNQWPVLFHKTAIAGAVSGLGTYWTDPVVYVRFAIVVGLAFLTTSFWSIFDVFVLLRPSDIESDIENETNTSTTKKNSSGPLSSKMSKKDKKKMFRNQEEMTEDEELAELEAMEREEKEAKERKNNPKTFSLEDYRLWSFNFAISLSWFGILIAGPALWYYYFKSLPKDNPSLSFLYQTNWKILPILSVVSIFLPTIIITLGKWEKLKGFMFVSILCLTGLAVPGLYAITRQLIQNAQLNAYCGPEFLGETVEWSPLFAFLGVFVLGLLLIIRMIWQMARCRH